MYDPDVEIIILDQPRITTCACCATKNATMLHEIVNGDVICSPCFSKQYPEDYKKFVKETDLYLKMQEEIKDDFI